MVFAQELLPERRCHTCKAQQKLRWGCESPSTEPPIVIDDVELDRCPNRPLLDFPVFFNEVYRLYGWYGKNYFPDNGTWLDQANAFIEAIDIIERATSEARKIKEERISNTKNNMKGVVP